MWEWLCFWGRCFKEGLHLGHSICGGIETVCLVVAGFLFLKSLIGSKETHHEKKPTTEKKWEKLEPRIKKAATGIFVILLVLTTFLVAPFLEYEELKEKIEVKDPRKIEWLPPKISRDAEKMAFLFGGHFEELGGTMLVGTPIPIDIHEAKATNGTQIRILGQPAVIAHFMKDRLLLDLDVPTQGKLLQIRNGESNQLPDGWDWNADDQTLEIVDDQNRAIFREFYSTNFVCIKGVIQFQGQLLISEENGYGQSLPRVFFDRGQIGLAPIFKYPSSKYRSERLQK
jgi:hypothetical protein